MLLLSTAHTQLHEEVMFHARSFRLGSDFGVKFMVLKKSISSLPKFTHT